MLCRLVVLILVGYFLCLIVSQTCQHNGLVQQVSLVTPGCFVVRIKRQSFIHITQTFVRASLSSFISGFIGSTILGGYLVRTIPGLSRQHSICHGAVFRCSLWVGGALQHFVLQFFFTELSE